MNPVSHFEIHAANPERAIKFYTTIFAWKIAKWDGPMPYWMITTRPDDKPGINGGMLARQGADPVEGQAVSSYVCTVMVDSVDDLLKAIEANGGSIAHPKMPIPGMGWLAYGKDTEGNIFGIMKADPTAK